MGREAMDTPDYIQEFLERNPKALEVYQSLPPSHQSEYVRWIEEAKREETRARRMEKMMAMLLDREG
ncbi:MAG TPA: bacteriocin-protection protein [Planctomycetes bacterium]|nr:bacteriocin-protection protein [Planctomycetota bacterium]